VCGVYVDMAIKMMERWCSVLYLDEEDRILVMLVVDEMR